MIQSSYLSKIEKIVQNYEELTVKICDKDVIADNRTWQKLVKEHSDLTPIVDAYHKLKKCLDDMQSATELMQSETDSDLIDMAKQEIEDNKRLQQEIEQELKVMLLPKDENDDKDVIMEIRGGAGGDEAALFASELMRMYMMYAERHHFKVEILDVSEIELGGIKEATMSISGTGAYSKLKYESGVHRVQRVPETESQGRVHTSTATVAVLPELEEVEFDIEDKDLRVDTYRSSGAGGQHINKTDSAIRLTHLPTGIVVTCQDQRSQIKNREKAMTILRSKLYDYYQGQKNKEYADNRKAQVGTGDRSERIRTYNFPQGRISDHRIGYTAYNLLDFMNGDLDTLIAELQLDDQRKKLENIDMGNS